MPDLPLLLFPEPSVAERYKRPFPRSYPHIPNTQRQSERITPRLNALQQAFNARRIEVLQGTAGVDPEQVIVFETVGSIDKFINAVSKVEGFEWMGEIETEEIEPDDDFYNQEHPEKSLEGRLYLAMSNQTAMQQLLTLWNRIGQEEELDFKRGELRGLAKFRDVFKYLKDVRRWGVRDRVDETGIKESWEFKLQYCQGENIKFEIELWYRRNNHKRQGAINEISNLVENIGGNVLGQCVLDEINYCALLVELPPERIEEIIDNPNIDLVKSDSIMFFRPSGQMVTGEDLELESTHDEIAEKDLPTKDPIIGILDGLPLENHTLLTDRLLLEDPDGWSELYKVSERRHGTAVSSIIAHGDLNDSTAQPLDSLVYVRPIMQPYPVMHGRQEFIPDNILMVDLIHRAVKRIFEGEGTTDAVASTIKIINFSIGDPARLFDHVVSPLSRLLDWLSYKYKVLFIISSGNHSQEISLPVTEEIFVNLSAEEKEKLILRSYLNDARNRRLLAPAESINSITVAGINDDGSDYQIIGSQVKPYDSLMPSITNPIGGGFNRSIKPDIVYNAGEQLLQMRAIFNGSLNLGILNSFNAPGIKTASPSVDGTLTSTNYCRGSSFAAALVSRSGAICYENLKNILNDNFLSFDFPEIETCLLKALIIHGTSWGDIGDHIDKLLEHIPERSKRRNLIGRLIGNGIPDFQKAIECTPQRATVLGFEKLKDDEAHLYELPLPPSLSANAVKKRLTVTLAYLSPTVSTNMKYRHSQLFFTLNNNGLASDRQESDHHAVRRGTIQHEIFEGENAVPFEDGDSIKIKVNCRLDGGTDKNIEVSYGLAVSLEVAENIDIPIYNEIRTRIATAVQIQQQT